MNKIKAHFMKDKKKEETSIILATPENSEIVEDSPRCQRAANRIIQEIKEEKGSIAPEKKCTCQLEDTQMLESDTKSTLSASLEDAPTKQTAGQVADSNTGSISSATGDRV